METNTLTTIEENVLTKTVRDMSEENGYSLIQSSDDVEHILSMYSFEQDYQFLFGKQCFAGRDWEELYGSNSLALDAPVDDLFYPNGDKGRPEFWLIKLEERSNWSEDIQAKTASIYSVYLYDRNRHTHVCDINPSYEMLWLYTGHEETDFISDDEEARTALSEEIRYNQGSSEDNDYYKLVSDIENSKSEKFAITDIEWKELMYEHHGNREEAYEAAILSIREYQDGNPHWC